MKKYIIYILLLISASTTAQVKIGADGSMHPTGSYPTSVQRETKGYVLSVQSIVDRNAIPANFRDTGMIVLVRNDSSFYSLVGGVTNSNWQQFLQGGFSGSGIDSIFITSTDSIFVITTNNDTIYIGSAGDGTRDTANLSAQWGIQIFNDDNTYKPNGGDVAIAADSVVIKNYVDSIIRSDTTISQSIGDIDYVVDTVSNSPPVQPDGYKVLVGTSPTGAFATHADQVATKVGGVYTYVTATTNQSLEVRNATQLFFYKKTDFGWIRVSVADLVGGITGIVQPDIGTIDSNSFTIKTKNIPAISIDALQNTYLNKYLGLEDSNLFFKPGINGLIDTGHFHQLIAGDNITIVGDTISATGGGGSSALFPTSGTGTATSDVTGDLDGHSLTANNSSSITLSGSDNKLISENEDGKAESGTALGEGDYYAYLNATNNDLSINHYLRVAKDEIQLYGQTETTGLNLTLNTLDSSDADANNMLWIGAGNKVHRGHLTAGGGSTNLNIGSGYRLTVPATNNIKTLHAGTNITIDSVTNANELTINSSGGSSTDSLQQVVARKGNSHNYISVGDSSAFTSATTQSIVFFGNSLTNASYLAASSRFSTLVAFYAQATEINRGIASTTMQSYQSPTIDSSMVGRIYLIPTYNSTSYKGIVFEYGINDITFINDTATFRASYYRVLDTCIARGWPVNRIAITTIPYISSLSYNRAQIPNYNNVIKSIATVKGVGLSDVYQLEEMDGRLNQTVLYSVDSLHPNALGHQYMTQAVLNGLRFKHSNILNVNGNLTSNYISLRDANKNKSAISFEDSSGAKYAELKLSPNPIYSIRFGDINATSPTANNYSYGFSALNSSSLTGTQNIAIGTQALQLNTTGTKNVGIGYSALKLNTTGGSNTGVGDEALINLTTGGTNTAVGANALHLDTSGGANVAIGASAMSSNRVGTANVAIGVSALSTANTTGNTAIGYTALTSSTGQFNTAAGYRALMSNSGNNNTAYGFDAAVSTTSGNGNVFLGYRAARVARDMGAVITSATSGVYLGADATPATNGTTNEVVIGASAVGNGSNTSVIGNSSSTQTDLFGDFGNVVITPPITSTTPSTTGGSILAGTYIYTLTANDGTGRFSLMATEASATTTGTTSSVTLNLPTLPLGATSWNIYRRTSVGTYGATALITSGATGASYVDILASPTTGTPATTGTAFINKITPISAGNSYINNGGKFGIGTNAPTSTLQVSGSFAPKYNATATGITLDATYSVVEVTATGQTITLPTAASITGRVYTIKLTASGTGTVATTSSQTIDGSTTYSLSAQYKYVTVQSNGSNWIIIANN